MVNVLVWLMVVLWFFGFFTSSFFWIKITDGLVKSYFQVWLKKNKRILVKVYNPLGVYYTVGRIQDGFVIIKIGKQTRRVPLKKDFTYLFGKVFCIDYDEETNNFFVKERPVVSYDTEKYEGLFERALYRPSRVRSSEKWLLLLLLVLLVGVGISIALSYSVNEQIKSLVVATVKSVATTTIN